MLFLLFFRAVEVMNRPSGFLSGVMNELMNFSRPRRGARQRNLWRDLWRTFFISEADFSLPRGLRSTLMLLRACNLVPALSELFFANSYQWRNCHQSATTPARPRVWLLNSCTSKGPPRSKLSHLWVFFRHLDLMHCPQKNNLGCTSAIMPTPLIWLSSPYTRVFQLGSHDGITS